MMAWLYDRVYLRLFTRSCRGCSNADVHTHHLTWLGRKRFT